MREQVGRMPRGVRIAVPIVVVLLVASALLSSRDDDTVVTASDRTTTTEEATSTTEATTTTSETTTTTAPPTTTTAAPPPPTTTTAPPAPPPPPTTAPTGPATPTEFSATVRGVDQGPDYYAIIYGTTFGASGGFHVIAKCRSGTVTVTVLEDGWEVTPPTSGGPPRPINLWVWADDTEIYHDSVTDGTVISGGVAAKVAVRISGPSEHDVRVRYDCRG